jgi:hypothetical protein
MAGIADSIHTLRNNPSHKANLLGKEEINTVLYHLSTHGSSQLGYYCEAYFTEKFNLRSHEKTALIELIRKSKMSFASLSEKERNRFCLGECQHYQCPASNYRFPQVRSFTTECIAKECTEQNLSLDSCCFFISGELAHEYEILKEIAHTDLKKIILIDKKYQPLIEALNGTAERPLSITDTCPIEADDQMCNDIFAKEFPRGIETALDKIFTLTATARIIKEFNTRAKKLFPNLAKLLVCATAGQFITECQLNPAYKPDLLIACDFKNPACREFKFGPWQTIRNDFKQLQASCIKETGSTWSLTASSDEKAHLHMTSATKKTEWKFEGNASGILEGMGFWSEMKK